MKDDIHALHIKIPRKLHRKLKKASFEYETTMTDIIIETLNKHLVDWISARSDGITYPQKLSKDSLRERLKTVAQMNLELQEILDSTSELINEIPKYKDDESEKD